MSIDQHLLLFRTVIVTSLHFFSFLRFGTRLPTTLRTFLLLVTFYEIGSVMRTFQIRTNSTFLPFYINSSDAENGEKPLLPIPRDSFSAFGTWISAISSSTSTASSTGTTTSKN